LAIAKKLGVDVFLDSPCETFSSGMMKKLSLVLVFLGTPRLILLDEPFITLDEQARYSLYELIQQSFQSPDTVILISSHQDIDTTMLPIKATYRIHHQILEP
jgi:ABC-2 type transport system ATP-binding protein